MEKEAEEQIEELERLRKVFRRAETEKDRMAGRLSALIEDIKDRYGISTVGQARKRLKMLETKREKITEELETLLDELQEEQDIWEAEK